MSQRPVVTMLAFRRAPDGVRLLLQKRTKSRDDTPYDGYFELPQGKMRSHETLEQAARRELKEETGIVEAECQFEQGTSVSPDSAIYWEDVLYCVVDSIQNHISLVVPLLVEGEARDTNEAAGHVWCTQEDLARVLNLERVFPLNRPVLERVLRDGVITRMAESNGIPDRH